MNDRDATRPAGPAVTFLRMAAAFVLALAFIPCAAIAGPPYLTDDPVPVDLGHWEIYGFSQGTIVEGERSLLVPATEVNYGALPGLQLHMMVPMALASQNGLGTQYGIGDSEIGFKYRFVNPGKDSWVPQVGIFPTLVLPSGNAVRGLGTGRAHEYLPVWLQEDFGTKWSTNLGAGYWNNPGPGNRNFWFFGWLVQYQLTEQLAVGAEIFHQTASSTALPAEIGYPAGTRPSTGFNLGAVYDFNEHHHLLASAGSGLQNARQTNQFSYYFGYQFTF